MISLTGSVGAGKSVARASAETLKRVHLELGGKAPVIVFDDADIEAVIAKLKQAFYNSGQDCTAPCRVIAGAEVYDDFVAELTDAVGIVVGDPMSTETEMGPVISDVHRCAHRRIRRSGPRRRRRGHRRRVDPGRSGFFYEPSVVVGVDQAAEIIQREVFGPVITVQPAADEETALAMRERRRLRPRRERVDVRRRPGDADEQGAAVRHGVGQRPHPDRLRDAPRRLQAVGLRQGHVDVRRRALHRGQARHDQALNPRFRVRA